MTQKLKIVTIVLHALACVSFLIASVVSMFHAEMNSSFLFALACICMLISTVSLVHVYREDSKY